MNYLPIWLSICFISIGIIMISWLFGLMAAASMDKKAKKICEIITAITFVVAVSLVAGATIILPLKYLFNF